VIVLTHYPLNSGARTGRLKQFSRITNARERGDHILTVFILAAGHRKDIYE